MTPAEKTLLRTFARRRSKAEMKALFKLARANTDRTLLAALAPPTKAKPKKRAGDPLTRDIDRILKPVLAPAAEKADLLIEHMARAHRRKLKLVPKGLAETVRGLRTHFTDAQIREGGKALMADLSTLYDGREKVV